MLNGAYAVGTPDCVSHLAEEIPNPRKNIPLAIAAQMVIGFFTALFYMIAIFYSISDLDEVLLSPTFPLAIIYRQATGTRGGTLGLLLVILFPILCTLIGAYITAGRVLWTLARDDATPFPKWLGKISDTHHNPFNATIFCGCLSTVLGAIYVGSATAFNAFVGAFVVLSTLSYLSAVLPFVLTGRFKAQTHSSTNTDAAVGNGMRPGPYSMSPAVGYTVNIISCLYIVVFIVIYCFPYAIPFNAVTMNYASLITGGLTIFIGLWWLVRGKRYVGPQALIHHEEGHVVTSAPVTKENGV
jgi:choline transport protein